MIKKLDVNSQVCYICGMTRLADQIAEKINSLPRDVSFGYGQLGLSKQDYSSAAKILERQRKKGIIKKLSKGVFYKPKMTAFGEKKPSEEQILKPYLYSNGEREAYLTGTYLYNQMGLTTQVPTTIQIASRDKRIFINRGTVKATPVKSYVDVSEENYKLLGLLDALKDLKQIPDVDINQAGIILKNQIGSLKNKQLAALIEYALKYPPRVQALLGAILSDIGKKQKTKELMEGLNPLTVFKLGLNTEQFPSAQEWNIQ